METNNEEEKEKKTHMDVRFNNRMSASQGIPKAGAKREQSALKAVCQTG